jgi:hypothetical protein
VGHAVLSLLSLTQVRYSLSGHSLLFRIVVPNFMSLGADLQWISAFPDEAEVIVSSLVPCISTSLPPSCTKDLVRRRQHSDTMHVDEAVK